MNVKPVTFTVSKRKEAICRTAIFNDNYLMTKVMIYENYRANRWVGRVSAEEYFTFLPLSEMKDEDSLMKAFSLYTTPFTVLDVYNEIMKNREIDPASNEGKRYLLNLYKAIYTVYKLMSNDENNLKSITAAVYSSFSFYLNGYEDDIVRYGNIYSPTATANFPKEKGETFYNIVLNETFGAVCSNLTTVLYTLGYDAEKLVDEVDEELKELFKVGEEGGTVSTSINKLNADADHYFFRNKDMDEVTAQNINARLQQAMVEEVNNINDDCEK